MSERAQWAVGLLIAVVVLGALLAPGDDESGDEPQAERSGPSASEKEAGAQVVCEDEVRDQLKSPSTADFSEVEVAKVEGDKYAVKGAVDSENSFGGTLRAFWVCDAEWLKGSTYRVDASVLE